MNAMDESNAFSDDEVREILRLAARRQDESERASLPGSAGLRLDQMTEIARGVGIEPAHVRAAAREVALRRGVTPVGTRFGIPKEVRVTRVLPGPVTDEEWEPIVEQLRRMFGVPGVASQYGGVREWLSGVGTRETAPIVVRVEAAEDGTIMTASQDAAVLSTLPAILGGSFLLTAALLGGAFAVGSFEAAVWLIPALFIGLAGVSFGGAIVGGRVWAKRQVERLATALDRAELIHRSSHERSG